MEKSSFQYKDLLCLKEYKWYKFSSNFRGSECNGVLRKIETCDGFVMFRFFSNCKNFNEHWLTGVRGMDMEVIGLYDGSWNVAESNFSEFENFKIIKD